MLANPLYFSGQALRALFIGKRRQIDTGQIDFRRRVNNLFGRRRAVFLKGGSQRVVTGHQRLQAGLECCDI